jgi:DNA-binding GntR family transcriptional regulator
LEGRLHPHQRLKIRDLAAAMNVSETPVREAVMQLVRERALVLQTSKSLTVPRLSVSQFLELRRIRLELEGLAAAEAAVRVTDEIIRDLELLHERLLAWENLTDPRDAVRLNWRFHDLIYRTAEMPELLNLIEGLWLRTGPLLAYQYPHAKPSYPGRHRHLDMIDALRARDAAAARAAVWADALEGGAALLQLLTDLDEGRLDEASLAEGASMPLPGPRAEL